MELDTAAGMVLTELERSAVDNNTIVFLTGDNGPPEDQCDWGGSKGVRPLRRCVGTAQHRTSLTHGVRSYHSSVVSSLRPALLLSPCGTQPFLGSTAKTAAGGGGSAGKIVLWH